MASLEPMPPCSFALLTQANKVWHAIKSKKKVIGPAAGTPTEGWRAPESSLSVGRQDGQSRGSGKGKNKSLHLPDHKEGGGEERERGGDFSFSL